MRSSRCSRMIATCCSAVRWWRLRNKMTEGDFCRASARSAPKSVSPEMRIHTSVACHVEKHVIVCPLESAFEGVDSVVACFA